MKDQMTDGDLHISSYRNTYEETAATRGVEAGVRYPTVRHGRINILASVIVLGALSLGAQAQTSGPSDTVPPTIRLANVNGIQFERIARGRTFITNRSSVTFDGVAYDNVGVTRVAWSNDRGGAGVANGVSYWVANVALQSGMNQITIAASDASGNSASTTVFVILDTTPPKIAITSPAAGTEYTTPTIEVDGTASDDVLLGTSFLWVNDLGHGGLMGVGLAGDWHASQIPLKTGLNTITVTASDLAGNTAVATIAVVYTPLTGTLAKTTTTVAAVPASIISSGSVAFTATVTPNAGTTAPSGCVVFSVGPNQFAVPLTASGVRGTATLSVMASSLSFGRNGITANYMPSGNFAGSSGSTNVTVTGSAGATSTTVVGVPYGIDSKQSVALTATITPVSGSAAPTGSVVFSLGPSQLGTAAVTAAGSVGSATLTVAGSALTLGSTNRITATYIPSGGFIGSTGSTLVSVTGVLTTTTVATVPAAIFSTGSTQLTATVTPTSGAPAPAGSVVFSFGSTQYAVPLTTSGTNGSATLSVPGSAFTTGAVTIAATYLPSPSSGFLGSLADTTLTVTSVATRTAAVATPASITPMASTQLTATVTPASGSTAPFGSVTFSVGPTQLGTATLAATGSSSSASVSVAGSKLAIGKNTITANYTPTGGFTASTGSVTVTVNAPPASTTITVTANPATFLVTAPTTLTILVAALTGTATPSGSVTCSAGATQLGTSTLDASGKATLNIAASKLTVGTDAISCLYTPASAANFTASTGTVTVTANAAPVSTTTTVTANPTTFLVTAPTTLSIVVAAVSGNATPAGTVTCTVGTTQLGTSTLDPSGKATVAVAGSKLTVGTDAISCLYTPASAGIFTASTGTVTVTANAAPVSTTTTVTANPTTFLVTAPTTLSIVVAAVIGNATPAGTVTCTAGTTQLGTSTLDSSGKATLIVSASKLPVGSDSISCAYSPAQSANFSASNGTVMVVTTASPQPGTVQFGYDSRGRLVTVIYNLPTGTLTVTYNYDDAGNRTSVVIN